MGKIYLKNFSPIESYTELSLKYPAFCRTADRTTLPSHIKHHFKNSTCAYSELKKPKTLQTKNILNHQESILGTKVIKK